MVGHIYQLGTKYSAPLDATFVDEDDADEAVRHGELRHRDHADHGGGGRAVATTTDGIIWPKVMAPFEVIVIVATGDHEAIRRRRRDGSTRELAERGIDVLIDDREEPAGVKFADADLIGYPVQVVVGKRGVETRTVDLKLRATGERVAAGSFEAAQAAVETLAEHPHRKLRTVSGERGPEPPAPSSSSCTRRSRA